MDRKTNRKGGINMISFLLTLFNKVEECLYRLALLVTFISVIPLLGFIIYSFIFFNPIKILIGCITIVIMVHVNKSMKGGSF